MTTSVYFEGLLLALRKAGIVRVTLYSISGDGFRVNYWEKIPDDIVKQFNLVCCLETEDDDCGWLYGYKIQPVN